MAEYIVKSGDTLGKIAQQYGVTVNQLAQTNKISNPNMIFSGQKLEIGEIKSNCDTFESKKNATSNQPSYEDGIRALNEIMKKEVNKYKAAAENYKASNGLSYNEAKDIIRNIREKYKGDFTCMDIEPWVIGQDEQGRDIIGGGSMVVNQEKWLGRLSTEEREQWDAANKAVEELESKYPILKNRVLAHMASKKEQSSEIETSNTNEKEEKSLKDKIGKFYKGWAKAALGIAGGNGFLGFSGLKEMFS
ncbi:MAG: LysM peptidoglycan-binding domain-containing protein [Opitutales bacterium]